MTVTNQADDGIVAIINGTMFLPSTDEKEPTFEEKNPGITVVSIESELDTSEENPDELCNDPSQVNLSILHDHPDLDSDYYCGHSKTIGFTKMEEKHGGKLRTDQIPDEDIDIDVDVDVPSDEIEGPREKKANGKNKYCHIAEGAATIGCKNDVPTGTKRLCKIRIGTLRKVTS